MYVKSLRMAGFKSFADPTILDFEPAVNVIVGPNGSGKSNIADALSWVLGSQAPSSLRGGSMEDVIFAGSEARPRLGMAEVELTLDNQDRLLPLDLGEVAIARTTDRTGASEYRINGAPCRLLDIAELLSDTGIGRSLHTVVGQGRLDEILGARPEERRAFIEEAAQIGKYRRRKDRSRRKIERVDDNMMRLHDVLSELRRALRPLKRQASAASAYSELLAEQRTLRQRLAATEIARLDAGSGLDPAAEDHRATLLADELAHVRARLESAAGERQALAGAADEARGVAHRMARTVDRLEALGRLAGERAETIAARLASETEEGYRERIRLLDAHRARWHGELAGLAAEADRLAGSGHAAAGELRAARAQREAAERALAEARRAETSAAEALVRAEGAAAAGHSTLGATEARVDAVVERRSATEHELHREDEALAKAEAEVHEIEDHLDSRTRSAAQAEERLEEARAHCEGLKEHLGATRSERAAAAARHEALQEVAALFAGHDEVLGRLGPLLDAAGERARRASLTQDEAARILREAEAEVRARAEEVESHDEELRRLDAIMSAAADRLAGRRRRRERCEAALAALDDELARAREALASAHRAAAEEAAALPARRAALDETRRAAAEAESAASLARRTESEATTAATAAQMEARSARERALAARLRLEEAEGGIADAESALAGLEDRRAALAAARARAETVARGARSARRRGQLWCARAETHADAARAASEEGDRRLAALRTRERELSDRLDEATRRRNEAEVRRAQNEARKQAIGERSLDDWGLSLDELASFETFRPEEEAAARERVEKLDRDLKRFGAVNPRAGEEHAELAERESFLVGQIEDLKASKRDLLKVLHEVDETIVEVFGDAFEAVAHEFEIVFSRLFPGGTGRLTLTDPDDLLASGIEVEARPAGKNVRKLSLLSGGERSLVALAYLFAIFRARPSPFYLLDEVEAALDDVNLQRFLGLVAELEERAQVLVVTHQKRTMEAADVLYGVSMAAEGVSLVIAKRMEDLQRSSA